MLHNLKSIFKQFRTARHLTSVLAEVNDEDIGAMVIKLVKLIFMLDYVLFHSIQKAIQHI